MKVTAVFPIIFVATALLAAPTGNRKMTNNKMSPPAETSITLGGQPVTIEYNAPSARGRRVEGGLIPYGTPWRLGADSATTLTTGTDIMIGNLRVPKGVHTLYLAGAEGGAWKLIVNKQTGQWGTEYSQGQDLGRVDMKVTKLSAPVETLKISLVPSGASAGTLDVEWGSSKASVPVRVP
jgi:hypothetical protein